VKRIFSITIAHDAPPPPLLHWKLYFTLCCSKIKSCCCCTQGVPQKPRVAILVYLNFLYPWIFFCHSTCRCFW